MINIEISISITKFRKSCPQLINYLSLLNFFTPTFVAKKLDDLQSELLNNGSLTAALKIMSGTFFNEFSSVYSTGNLNFPVPHQVFCSHLESIVITKNLLARVCHLLTLKPWDMMIFILNY